MKGVFSWLVRWACRAGTRDFCSALAAIAGPDPNIFFPRRTLFQFLCPNRPASWAGSRVGSPVSYCLSLHGHGTPVHCSRFRSKSIANFTFLVQDFMFIVRKYT
jgi:hypothetical protein